MAYQKEKLSSEEVERRKKLTDQFEKTIDAVEAQKPTIVGKERIRTAVVVPSLNKTGNRLTSVVESRSISGHLITNTIVSTVQDVDDDFLMHDIKFLADLARAERFQNGEVKITRGNTSYNSYRNYHASPTIQGQGCSLREVMLKYQAGIPTTDKSERVSFDTDLPFINERNWHRLGGMKYQDFAEIPTPYQSDYSSSSED